MTNPQTDLEQAIEAVSTPIAMPKTTHPTSDYIVISKAALLALFQTYGNERERLGRLDELKTIQHSKDIKEADDSEYPFICYNCSMMLEEDGLCACDFVTGGRLKLLTANDVLAEPTLREGRSDE